MNGSFKFDDEAVRLYQPMVLQVASEYHKKYRMVEREDIAQQLWIWFGTHIRKMNEWKEYEEKDRSKLIAKSLRNEAYDFCIKEKSRVEGYNPEDVFYYRKEFIKMLLPAVVANDWARIENSLTLGGKAPKAPAEANDWMAYSADINKALNALSDEERRIVIEFYGNDMDGATLHEHILPEKSTARAAMMQANRALNKMVRELGGFPPFNDPKDNEGEQHAQEVQE